MRSRDSFCARYVDPRNLFAVKAAIVDEVIARLACEWKRPLRAVGLFQIAHETDGAITSFRELASGCRKLTVIVIDENRIASDRIEPAIPNSAVSRAFRKNRTAPMDRPVTQRGNIVRAHVSA